MSIPDALLRPVRRVVRRIRLQRALDSGARLGIAALLGVLATLIASRLGGLDPSRARWLSGAAVALPFVGAMVSALRHVSLLAAARLLDRSHATEGRIASGLELSLGTRAHDAWERAAIDDAVRAAPQLEPARAIRIRAPRGLRLLAGLGCAVVVVALYPSARQAPPPSPQPPGITPVLLHEDDLQAHDERLRQILDAPDTAAEVRAEAEALNRVLEDLADRRIDRLETLRRLAEIEARIAARRPADPALIRDTLRVVGEPLTRSEFARQAGEAMQRGELDQAAQAMRELGERLRAPNAPNRAELERLRRALEEAARERAAEESSEIAEREQEMERLLQRRTSDPAEAQRQQRLLDQRRRELDQLRREHEQRQAARRELDRLQRELSEAARELAQQGDPRAGSDPSEHLDQGAEDLNRMAQDEMSQEQMQELQRQIEELREAIRRQRQQQQGAGADSPDSSGGGEQGESEAGSQGGSSRMDRFVLRARGQGDEGEGDEPSVPIGVPGGAPSQGQGGQESSGGAGQQTEGQEGASGEAQGPGQGGQSAGAGGSGEGDGESQQRMLMLGGEGNAELVIPGRGTRSGGDGSEGDGSQGAGSPGSGSGAGDQHAPGALGDPTARSGEGRTVQVQGETRRGPTRSEVIRTAAQRGFASEPYRDVYTDYAEHAEEALERDEVPPGYRFYVRRYFQLIRPRDTDSP